MIGFEPGYEARVVADEVRFNIPDYLLQAALDASYAAKDHTHTADQISGLEGALGSYLTKTDAASTYEPLITNGLAFNDTDLDKEDARFFWLNLAGEKFRASWNGIRTKLKAYFDGIYATQSSVGAKVSKAGDTMSGSLTVGTTLAVASSGNAHVWFRNLDGSERAVVWADLNSGNLNVRVGGVASSFTPVGDFVAGRDLKAPGWLYAGNGASHLEANGNVIGSIWGNYGYGNDAYTAITNRIEQRARDWAVQEANYVRNEVGAHTRNYLLGEDFPLGSVAMCKIRNSTTFTYGQNVGGGDLIISNAGNLNGSPVNYGTWRVVSSSVGGSTAGLVKRIG